MENQRDGLQNKLTDGKTAGKYEAFSNLARSTCNMHCRDHFFLKCAHGSGTVDLLFHGDPTIDEKQITATKRKLVTPASSCAPRRSMICTDCATLTSDSKCSSLSRTNE